MIAIILAAGAQAGWLTELTDFIRRQVERLWTALVDFFRDLVIYALEQSLSLIATAFEKLPAPEFLTQYNLNSLLGSAGATVGWFVDVFKIADCLAVISLGVTFFILRKILTFGKW